jgi:hypothetical protein
MKKAKVLAAVAARRRETEIDNFRHEILKRVQPFYPTAPTAPAQRVTRNGARKAAPAASSAASAASAASPASNPAFDVIRDIVEMLTKSKKEDDKNEDN